MHHLFVAGALPTLSFDYWNNIIIIECNTPLYDLVPGEFYQQHQ